MANWTEWNNSDNCINFLIDLEYDIDLNEKKINTEYILIMYEIKRESDNILKKTA